jgi:beta-lactamase regulating signal transducer with metallopeptidase domain
MKDAIIPLTNVVLNYLGVASVIAACVTPLIWGVIKILKVRTPVYRHMIWQYALIAIIALPVIWLYGPRLKASYFPAAVQSTISAISSAQHQFIMAEPDQNRPAENAARGWLPSDSPVSAQDKSLRSLPMKTFLAGMWIAGVIFMLGRLFKSWRQLGRMVRSAEPTDAHLRFQNVRSGRLKVLSTHRIQSPVCLGLWRPVILLPQQIYRRSSDEDLQMILNHELAHIQRGDCWVNFFQRVIESIFFFHPFVWYASFQITQQREQICDNHVIVQGATVMNYSKLLSRIVEQGFEKNTLQAVALFEGRLLSRIRSLLDPKHRVQVKASRWAAIVGAVVILMLCVFGSVRLEAQSPPKSSGGGGGIGGGGSGTVSATTNGTFSAQAETVMGDRPTGNCSLGGQVLSAETGKPIGQARVYLFYQVTYAAVFINTDDNGRFEFKDIPTGPFSLQTSHVSGFQDVVYNPLSVPGQFPQFTLNEGEKRTDLVLKVEPACSISGRILDENDTPCKDSDLTVMAWVEVDKQGNGNRYKIAGQTQLTADGSYLLDGLDNRPVYIMALDWRCQEKDSFYPPCYYPGTVARDEAQMVNFNNGSSVKNIDIVLKKKGNFVLEGAVTDATTGKAIPKTLITIHHRDMLFDRVTTYTDEQGRYRLDSLGAGDFQVHVDAKPWGYVRTRIPVTLADLLKTVQLNFTLNPAAEISGKFVDEQGRPAKLGSNAYGLAYRQGYPNPECMEWSGACNKYSEKGTTGNVGNVFTGGEGDYEEEYMAYPTPGTFVIEGMMPGHTVLSFHPKLDGQVVKAILYNGQDVKETGLETKPDEVIEGVTIVVGVP